jgi:hypothetical protein
MTSWVRPRGLERFLPDASRSPLELLMSAFEMPPLLEVSKDPVELRGNVKGVDDSQGSLAPEE